jgi:hypothetical protein
VVIPQEVLRQASHIIHIHCNKQLFFILSLSIDITEEGCDVGDDSDNEDFEPVMLISYVSVVTSVTQIGTDLHLLLMSFPSSDVTSTGLDHGQRSL